MGGYGSGLWRTARRKLTVDESLSIDVGFLHREGFLDAGHQGNLCWPLDKNFAASITIRGTPGKVVLCYRVIKDGASEQVRAEIPLISTTPHYGGIRFWFLCPLDSTGGKLGKLYLPAGASIFACRECHNLTYASCQESSLYGGNLWQKERTISLHGDYFKTIVASNA